MHASRPFQLLLTERTKVFRYEAATYNHRVIHRLPAFRVNAYGGNKIFCQPNAMATDTVERLPAESAIGANGYRTVSSIHAHLCRAVKAICLFCCTFRSE